MTRHITYQQEFLCSFAEESKELLQLHWQEIALNRDRIKLNPDWDAYEALESSGVLKVFTARSDNKLVGYFVVLVGNNLHYKDHLFATNDVIFLHRDYRKGLTGYKLIKFAEKCLSSDGVSVLNINTKLHKDFGPVLSRGGYNPIETVYSKYIKKENN